MQLACQIIVALILVWNGVVVVGREKDGVSQFFTFIVTVVLGLLFYGAGSFSLIVK